MPVLKLSPVSVHLSTEVPPVVSVDKRELTFIASNDSKVIRYDWFKGEKYYLSFSHEPGAIGLERVNGGQCMFTKGHSSYFDPPILGQVKNAVVGNGKLTTTHLIGGNNDAEQYWLDAQRGVIPGVSIEAYVTELTVIKKAVYESPDSPGEDDDDDNYWKPKKLLEPAELLATKWELMAVSSVVTPAIVGASVKNSSDSTNYSLVCCSQDTGYEWLENSDKNKPIGVVKMSDSTVTPDTDRLSAMATEIRDLKIQLSDSQKTLTQLADEKSKATLTAKYWTLRCSALVLYALQNKYTEDDFKLDFSDDSAIDLEQLLSMSAEGANLHLMGIERDLTRAARKQPIERLTSEAEKVLVSNRSVTSTDPVISAESRQLAADASSSETATAIDADQFLLTYQPRPVGGRKR